MAVGLREEGKFPLGPLASRDNSVRPFLIGTPKIQKTALRINHLLGTDVLRLFFTFKLISPSQQTHEGGCYGLNSVAPNSYLEALTPNVTVFEDRTFKEIIKEAINYDLK